MHAPMPEGSFYLWCSKAGLDGWELAAEIAERSALVVSPGELYGEDGRDFVRLAVVQSDERLALAAVETPRRLNLASTMATMSDLETRIDQWFDDIAEMTPENVEARRDVELVITKLDDGQVRVAEIGPTGDVVVHEWVRKAILLLFRLRGLEKTEVGPFEYLDRLELKRDYERRGVRVVPGASARRGSFLSRGVILMPSYVNIGAWVGENTMVDTWATVGSCAQIGSNVHLSGGVGIGGVLEPANACPS